MALLPLRYKNLPIRPFNAEYEIGNLPDSIWKIDLPNHYKIIGPLAMSYLLSISNDDASDFLEIFQNSPLESYINSFLQKSKRVFRKLNPFLDRYAFHNLVINKFVHIFKYKIFSSVNLSVDIGDLFSDTNSTHLYSFLQGVTNILNRDICLYEFDPEENCKFHFFSSKRSNHPKLIIFYHVYTAVNTLHVSERFGFGLPINYGNSLKRTALLRILKKTDLTTEEINKVVNAGFFERNFLICLLQSSSKDIIPKLYKSPYIARKLAETGFETDPRCTDENGFSAFHYCMEMSETHLLWMLYDFAANNFRLKDHTVRNPNSEILTSLKEIGEVIEHDISKSGKITAAYKKSSEQILVFNRYQREVTEGILSRRQIYPPNVEQSKQLIIFILNKYKEYFYFDLPHVDYVLNAKDGLIVFEDYVRRTEYYENVDAFNYLLFFDNFPHIISSFNENNRSIFLDTLSSMFLSILSNRFFTTKKHGIHCNNCVFPAEICENKNNALRFIPLHFRMCFLEKATSMVAELKCSTPDQKGKLELLQIITRSLANLPEIEDEFIINRLHLYLSTAIRYPFHDSKLKKILIFERTLQVIGEVLQNKTASKTVVRFMLSSCIFPELEHKLSQIRNHCLSHYRSSSVQGRVQIERKNQVFLNNIQTELFELNESFKPVYFSQILRTKEFLIKKCKSEAEKICKNVLGKLDLNLIEIADERKIFLKYQKKQFNVFLSDLLKRIFDKLKIENISFGDFIGELEALCFSLNFFTQRDEEYSETLIQIRDDLNNFISINKEKEITESIKCDFKRIFSSNEALFEEMFDVSKDRESPSNFPYLQSLFNEMKDYDILTCKEKKEIKTSISKYIQRSNISIQSLLENLQKGTITEMLNKQLQIIIMPEKKRSEIKKYIDMISKTTLLKEALNSLQHNSVFNLSHAEYLGSHVEEFDIFNSDETTKIKQKFLEYIKELYLQLRTIRAKNSSDEELRNISYTEGEKLRTQLSEIFTPQNKLELVEKIISKNIKKALNSLKSVKQEENLRSWYKEETNEMFDLELKQEEHISTLLKIQLPHKLKRKLIQIVNQKLWFLINRITQMKKILIFEDRIISSLWRQLYPFLKNKDVERYMKFLMVQRYMKEKQIRIPLEMLLFDCMGILKQKEFSDLWEKANNMFVGANMIELMAHGNPVVESAGSLLDPNDLPSEIVGKILELIKDEEALKALSRLWVETKLCKSSEFRSDVLNNEEKKFAPLRRQIKTCDRWENYMKLLPLKY
ncbi:uncharacterized protein NPIL_276051 [Nephila pilipes]|uniref:Uncharacterized protein n=1 Tax=Nephila pilipes TaxID=299642 RepID=A0A8X6UMR5_NEPPI|nr:uncharacterized protein NPIL_276051 [Nephila pilipes]